MSEEIIIKYKKDKKSIRLFGKDFVDNNKDKCKIVIDDIEEELKEFHEILDFKSTKKKKKKEEKVKKKNFTMSDFRIVHKKIKRPEDEELEIKLIGIEKVINASYMFSKCKSLLSIDISKWNTSNVKYMSYMFSHNKRLPSEIANFNTINVLNMSHLFYKCTKLETLPDISKWNTSNVTTMSNMFEECESLLVLPDISKWNTSKVTDMSRLFSKCKSLTFLPDISLWDTSSVENINCMFSNCSSLYMLPDLSRWKLRKLGRHLYTFRECYSLPFMPDFYGLYYTRYMFIDCINCINIHK